MNRSRNILLWCITAFFFVGLMFFVGVLNLWVAVVISMAAALTFVLLLRFRPALLGLQRVESQKSQVEIHLPEVFSPEIRLVCDTQKKPIEILIDQQDYLIGRGADCNFVIDGEAGRELAEHHIRIHCNSAERSYSVVALETPSRTRLNCTQLKTGCTYVIRKGDFLELANMSFLVESAYY